MFCENKPFINISLLVPVYVYMYCDAPQFKNKIKVYSVQLGKTLGLTKVPITETKESTQVPKK